MSVWRIPVEGGTEVKVLDSVETGGGVVWWVLGPDGIYFFTSPDTQAHTDLRLCDYATGQIKKIIMTERRVSFIGAVSPDGRTILYTQLDEAGSDLMLVENFR